MQHESQRSHLVVVGSANMDMVTNTPRRPARGETVIGTSFGTFYGGKGFNQAVAAARAGAAVWMVARIGQDVFGDQIMTAMQAEGIHTEYVVRDTQAGTGIASIVVDGDGDNSIIIVSGANMRLNSDDVRAALPVLSTAAGILLQLEIPDDALTAAATIGRAHGARVILNPAPARVIPEAVLRQTDILIPNETEAAALSGQGVASLPEVAEAARALHGRGPALVIVTLGERGALIVDGTTISHQPGFVVNAIDTTAAGDAFCGGLATALARGEERAAAVRYACAAGALTCTRPGASSSTPSASAIDALLKMEG